MEPTEQKVSIEAESTCTDEIAAAVLNDLRPGDAEQEAPFIESIGRLDEALSEHDSAAAGNEESHSSFDAEVQKHIRSTEYRLVELFEKKIAFDNFKEKQIERLHGELQEYKRGLAEALLLPLVKQLVRYMDQIPRHVASLLKRPADQLGPERLSKELEGVRTDLEMILENVGVGVFHHPEAKFDTRFQQARGTAVTSNAAEHGSIVERLLPGYELNGKIIEKERVKVFVYQDHANEKVPQPIKGTEQ